MDVNCNNPMQASDALYGGVGTKAKQINNNKKRTSPTIVSFQKSGALCFMYIALNKLSNKIFKKK
jgi:hypothetical protein